jgi:hypothetical protein
MTILRPVERLVGKEAHGGGARDDEVNKLRALEAQDAVSTGDDDDERYRRDDRP